MGLLERFRKPSTPQPPMRPVLLDHFYHDGRGPTLMKVHYSGSGKAIVAADYLFADEPYTPENLRHLLFVKPQVFMFTPEEVESYTPEFNPWEGSARFAAVDLGSSWPIAPVRRRRAKTSSPAEQPEGQICIKPKSKCKRCFITIQTEVQVHCGN